MPARKPGGKYKGKIPRSKGEATIAAELESKRRKAYEANLARLQERRQQELLAEQGMQSEEEEAMALKLARIAQMFGSGKKGTLTKFWKNWKIGMVNMRRERAIEERKFCWRSSCAFCDVIPAKKTHMHGMFGPHHMSRCGGWWTSALGREDWGNEIFPKEAKEDRPDVCNRNRNCTCCGADTGLPGLGCRSYTGLRDVGFMNPDEMTAKLAEMSRSRQTPADAIMRAMAASASAPQLATNTKMTISAATNWNTLKSTGRREKGFAAGVPEYDPSETFALSPLQAQIEERRAWNDGFVGAPPARIKPAELGTTMLPKLPAPAPKKDGKGDELEEVMKFGSGQKTMLDKHLMRMYVSTVY